MFLAGATGGFVVSEWTFKQLSSLERKQDMNGNTKGFRILKHVKIGTCMLVILQ